MQHIKSSCQKALDILRVVGHTDWGAGRAHRSATPLPCVGPLQIGLRIHCVRISSYFRLNIAFTDESESDSIKNDFLLEQ